MIRTAAAAAAVSCFAVLAVPATSQTQTVVIGAARDATLYEDGAGALANGGGQFLFAGLASGVTKRRALLEFDVAAAIPAGSRIVDVELRLVSSRSTAVAPTTATVHRVLADWGEGTTAAPAGEGGGGPAAVGDATWLHTFHAATFWSSPGGDFDPAPRASTAMPVLGAFTFTKTEELIADVQYWLTGRLPNDGWLVRTPENTGDLARRIDSRSNTIAANAPQLTVTFVPPGNIQGFGTGCLTSAGVPLVQTMAGPAVQGGAVTLSMSSGVPFGLFVTLLSYDVRTAPGIVDGCEIWLRPLPFPTLLIRGQDALGNSTDVFPLPNEPSLFGTPLAVQSILVDFASPRSYALSNAHLVCIQ
jgi:hypothetical protein